MLFPAPLTYTWVQQGKAVHHSSRRTSTPAQHGRMINDRCGFEWHRHTVAAAPTID